MQSPESTPSHLTDFTNLPLQTLRDRWKQAFGEDPPPCARSDYLVRALAFQIQAAAAGGVSRALVRQLNKLETSEGKSAKSETTRVLQQGARLLRDWKGTTHEVEVVLDGYRHLGTTYASLSEVARAITGTRWSGPLFFGLRTASEAIGKKTSAPSYTVDLSSKRAKVDGRAHVG